MVERIINWKSMYVQIKFMTEEEVKQVLNYELSTTNRKGIVQRLHQRYTRLRFAHEKELIKAGSFLF